MRAECIGHLSPDGHLVVSPEIIENFEVGERVRVRLEKLDDEPAPRNDNIFSEGQELLQLFENAGGRKELSPAAKRFVARMEHAVVLGVPDNSRKLSHAILAEERMEKKYPCTE